MMRIVKKWSGLAAQARPRRSGPASMAQTSPCQLRPERPQSAIERGATSAEPPAEQASAKNTHHPPLRHHCAPAHTHMYVESRCVCAVRGSDRAPHARIIIFSLPLPGNENRSHSEIRLWGYLGTDVSLSLLACHLRRNALQSPPLPKYVMLVKTRGQVSGHGAITIDYSASFA